MSTQKSQDLANHLQQQGIYHPQVLAAIANTPRELFVETEYLDAAYADHPLPIPCGQTISQPFIVALMTQEILQDKQLNRVLEIGTGSGYQAAILSQVVTEVYSIERIKQLYLTAKSRLASYSNVHLKHGDGAEGWEQYAPYDGIIVTAAASSVPAALCEQLAEGGRLIIPVDVGFNQELQLITRRGDSFDVENRGAVLFVPLLSGTQE